MGEPHRSHDVDAVWGIDRCGLTEVAQTLRGLLLTRRRCMQAGPTDCVRPRTTPMEPLATPRYAFMVTVSLAAQAVAASNRVVVVGGTHGNEFTASMS